MFAAACLVVSISVLFDASCLLDWFLADADPRADNVAGCIPQQAVACAEEVGSQACKKRSAAHDTEAVEAAAGPADTDSVLANMLTVNVAKSDQHAAVQQELEKQEKKAKHRYAVMTSQAAKRSKLVVPMYEPGQDTSDDESSSWEGDEEQEEEQGDNVQEEEEEEQDQ